MQAYLTGDTVSKCILAGWSLYFRSISKRLHWRLIMNVKQLAKLLTYLLTYSEVQSPSWEANWFAASQEIPRISRNPKVHYRTHKRPPPVSILGQPNHSIYPHPTSCRSVLILSTLLRLGLPSGLFPSGFPTKALYTPSPHPHAPHARDCFNLPPLTMKTIFFWGEVKWRSEVTVNSTRMHCQSRIYRKMENRRRTDEK